MEEAGSTAATAVVGNITQQTPVMTVTYLSDRQEVGIYLLVIASSILSTIGSSLILYKVLRNRHVAGTYDRLLFGLSSLDILSSFFYATTPFLLPSNTSTRAWASGNDRTCSVLGTMTQFCFAAAAYNAVLSVYYLLIVRFGIRKEVIAKRYERWMHAIPLFFYGGTAITGASMGLFSEVKLGPGCWIFDYPRNCHLMDDVTCIGATIGWFVAGVPNLLVFLVVIVNNIIIWRHVRKVLGTTPTNTVLPKRAVVQREHVRLVAQQTLFYIGAFWACYFCQFLIRVVDAFDLGNESNWYWLLVCDAILRPLQGFINMVIYTRPSYVRLRQAFPAQSAVWAMRRACVGSEIPRLEDIYNDRTNNNTSRGQPGVESSGDCVACNPTTASHNWEGGNCFESSLPVVLEMTSREERSVVAINTEHEIDRDLSDSCLPTIADQEEESQDCLEK